MQSTSTLTSTSLTATTTSSTTENEAETMVKVIHHHRLSALRVPQLADHQIVNTIAQSRITHVKSSHIEFDAKDITKMGIKTSWKQQTEEFKHVLEEHKGNVRRLLFIRHGEGMHNAAERDMGKERWETVEAKLEKYFDPSLNEVGVAQSGMLRDAIAPMLKSGDLEIDAVIVSPLSRAIETANIALETVEYSRIPMFAVEMARERHGKNTCDGRRTVSELRKRFPHVDFDHFMLDEQDPWHIPSVRETPAQVKARVEIFMHWVMELPFQTIAVVGHSDYMSHAVEVAGFSPHWPANCELVPMMITTTTTETSSSS